MVRASAAVNCNSCPLWDGDLDTGTFPCLQGRRNQLGRRWPVASTSFCVSALVKILLGSPSLRMKSLAYAEVMAMLVS